MDDNATPKSKRPGYSRPTKYPARLAVMLTVEQRMTLDAIAETAGRTLGEVTRDLLDLGAILYDVDVDARAEVSRLAREGGATEAEAIETMLVFAARESKRRLARNAKIAAALDVGLGEMGFSVDGIEVGGVNVSADGF